MHSHHSDSPDGSPQPFPRSRQDSAPLLMLPAPLALSNQHSSSQASSLTDSASTYLGSVQPDAHPNYRLLRAPDDLSSYGSEYRDSTRSEREPILASPVGSDSIMSPGGRNMSVLGHDAVVRNVPGGASYPGETPNPYRHSQHQVAAYDQMPNLSGYSAEEVDEPLPPLPNPPPRQRGVSLVDPGVVASPDGPVRRTPRSSKRSSATVVSATSVPHSRLKHQSLPPPPLSPPPINQYLPPGAAPPQPQSSGRFTGV